MFNDAKLDQFFDYYQDLRGEGAMARRSDFNPMTIRSMLPDLSVYDITSNDIVYRLSGTATIDRLGRNPVGDSLGKYVPPNQFEWLQQVVNTMLSAPCGVHVSYENRFTNGSIIQLDALGLPFETGAGQPPQIMVLHSGHQLIGYQQAGSATNLASRVTQASYVALTSDPVPHLEISAVSDLQDIAAD